MTIVSYFSIKWISVTPLTVYRDAWGNVYPLIHYNFHNIRSTFISTEHSSTILFLGLSCSWKDNPLDFYLSIKLFFTNNSMHIPKQTNCFKHAFISWCTIMKLSHIHKYAIYSNLAQKLKNVSHEALFIWSILKAIPCPLLH